MRALVTGCAGFIGSNLTEKLLSMGWEVVGIDCFTKYYPRAIKEHNMRGFIENSNFKFLEFNILDIPIDWFHEVSYILHDVDYVFHLAAQPGVRASWGHTFQSYTRNNIEATQRLLEAYKDKDLKTFVYSSSSSVYGNALLPLSENIPLRPVSPYGVTKLAAENLCYLYWWNYNVPTVSLRYFTVYGRRQRPDMAIHKFFKAIKGGKDITIYGTGEQTRDFTYIDDVVNATILATNSKAGEVYNIGGGSRISVNELIDKIEHITGLKANIRYLEQQKGDVHDTLADISKAKKVLGWEPKTRIGGGLKDYL